MTIDQIIERLRHERFSVAEGRDDFDRGWREGWNAARDTLRADLERQRTMTGLRELAEVG